MAGIDIISDSTGKEIVAAIQSTDVAQARILEINTAAESKKNEVLESIPEDYSNISKEVDELKGDLIDLSYKPNLDFYKNAFVSNESSVNNNEDTRMSKPIKLYKGQTISVITYGYLALVSIISTCDKYGTNTHAKIISTDSDKHTYKYKATEDCYVIVSYFIGSHENYCDVTIHSNSYGLYDKTEKHDNINITWNNGKFIERTSNTLVNLEIGCYSNPIKLNAGEKIVFNGLGYMANFGMIALCDANGDNIYSVVISSNEENMDKLYSYIAPFDTYVMLSSYKTKSGSGLPIDLYAYIEKVNEIKENHDNLRFCFNDIVCIGDSLTEGSQCVGSNPQITPWNYPYYLNKLTNWNCDNKGISGVSASVWWYNHQNDDFSSYDTAIVFLGTNNGLTDTIGEGAEVDTNTGNYLKIMNKLKNDNPNIRIFIITPWNREQSYFNTTVYVLEQIATIYNAKIIYGMDSVVGNIFDDTFRTIGDCHMNTIGYMYFAKFIKDKILEYANENPKEYNVNYPNYHS